MYRNLRDTVTVILEYPIDVPAAAAAAAVLGDCLSGLADLGGLGESIEWEEGRD